MGAGCEGPARLEAALAGSAHARASAHTHTARVQGTHSARLCVPVFQGQWGGVAPGTECEEAATTARVAYSD